MRLRPLTTTARPQRRSRRLPVLAAAACLGLLLAACGGGGGDAFSDASDGETGGAAVGETIVVGGGGFTEALIMMEVYKALLEDAGYTVRLQEVDSRELYFPAVRGGDIHLVPDYAATLADFLNRDANGPDAPSVATGDVDETVEALQELAEPLGLTVYEPSEAANQNAFFVTEQFAADNGLSTLSDLGEAGIPVVLAGSAECSERANCTLGLRDLYGIDVTETVPLGFGSVQAKQAVVTGQAQLGLSGTTDGTLSGLGLVVLEDDQSLQAADNLLPLVNVDGPANNDEVASVLNAMSEVLTTEDLAVLNRRVDEDRERPADVARDYLVQKGLLDG